MNESTINILYDHYKDSFSHIRERERQRDRLFLYVLGLLGLVLFQLHYSLLLQQTLTEINVFGITLKISSIPIPVLLSVSWTLLAVFLLKYYQAVIHIEKQFDYLHSVEFQLSELLGNNCSIERESTAYMTQKARLFRHWVWFFYTLFFPLIVLASSVWAITLEWRTILIPIEYRFFDSIIVLIIATTLVFYIIGVWIGRPSKKSNG